MIFDFRPFTRADYPTLSHWLKQHHVVKWWADDSSLAAIEKMYGKSIDKIEPCFLYIAELEQKPVEFLQIYRIDSYPQYIEELNPILVTPINSGSIDYMIGDLKNSYKGIGSVMLSQFIQKISIDFPDIEGLIVPTHSENIASWRVLEKTGFIRIASGELNPDNKNHSKDHYVYFLDLKNWSLS